MAQVCNLCASPGCGNPTTRRYCDRHGELERWRRGPDRRPSSAKRGYGRRWRMVREFILCRDPICRLCHVVPSTDVDHIIPKRKGGEDAEDNLQGVCHSCHSVKTGRGE